MSYSLTIKRSAAKTLSRIDRVDRQRIIRRIDQLRVNPLDGSVLKGEFEGLRRVRVGSYRVPRQEKFPELVELLILVVRIGHRKEVYRGN